MTIDNLIDQFVEDLNSEVLRCWANTLGVEINPPILDDMAQLIGPSLKVADYAHPGSDKLVREVLSENITPGGIDVHS